VRVGARVVAATNANLEEKIEEGRFRRDLYYRISVIQIKLPPLRQRLQDLPLLVRHFLCRLSDRLNRQIQITDPAMQLLMSYDWPGNVRELENVLERTAVLKTDPLIVEDDLDFLVTVPKPGFEEDLGLSELQILERDKISSVLSETRGNKSEAARRLGIERKTLYRKALRLGIDLDVSLRE
jgi:transcriptional regulator with PAS, ATPase and Fis domain